MWFDISSTHMIKDVLLRIEHAIPRVAEETRLRQKLFMAGNELIDAHLFSREDVARQPMSHQDVAIESHGNHIKDLALTATDLIFETANYTPYGMGPHYVKVGSGYWFSFAGQRLVQRTWRRNRIGLYKPDFKNAPDATPRDWYTYGVQAVENTLLAFQKVHQLPGTLRKSVRD